MFPASGALSASPTALYTVTLSLSPLLKVTAWAVTVSGAASDTMPRESVKVTVMMLAPLRSSPSKL